MNQFELKCKTIERKKGFITYLKEAEKISDFLKYYWCSSSIIEI